MRKDKLVEIYGSKLVVADVSTASVAIIKAKWQNFLFSSDAVLRQHASCALRDNADVGYRVPLLRRVAVCSCGPLISCRRMKSLLKPFAVHIFFKCASSVRLASSVLQWELILLKRALRQLTFCLIGWLLQKCNILRGFPVDRGCQIAVSCPCHHDVQEGKFFVLF